MICGADGHGWKDAHIPKPYPKEFPDGVVAVARRHDLKTTLRQIATDFRITESSLNNWLASAGREDGTRSGPTSAELEMNQALRRRNRLVEQENEVFR